jgi:hypothetical protein
MVIQRTLYLQKLIKKRNNGLIKVITGVRRCGKSFLLFNLYKDYLLAEGISEEQISPIALDNPLNAAYRDPLKLSEYISAKANDPKKQYYIFLDEIQFVGKKKIQDNPEIIITFYDVLNGLAQNRNYDIYVTGSNSKMLSTDIATEFRGRGDVLRIAPLSYKEIYEFKGGDRASLFDEYLLFGGLPLMLTKESDEEKKEYLASLFSETYFKDILEWYKILYPEVLGLITSDLCSSVGSLTNTTKIANTLWSTKKVKVDSETVAAYLKYLTDSYLFSAAQRYDVKGKRYFSYPNKYYCVDTGLGNARLNFRQIEETHLMENVVYNELRSRGYSVDVGVVESSERNEAGQATKVSREIDFVVNANQTGKKCYVQCALNIDSPAKEKQELLPFMKLGNDFNQRMIITKTGMKSWRDENGILHMGIYDFLLNEDTIL